MAIRLHKEGKRYLLIGLLLLILLNFLAFQFSQKNMRVYVPVGITTLAAYLFLLNFFRNPRRAFTYGEDFVVAPADGKIVAIEETEETEYFKDKRIQVSIFMSPFNVHINRNPISGMVRYFKYHPGKYLVAYHPKSSLENERTTVVMENDFFEILLRQIAGKVARKIVFYIKEDDEVQQGEEFGFIKFGSRVDIFLPLGTKVRVTLNQKVVGGITVLATKG